jgi:hypothetical protein
MYWTSRNAKVNGDFIMATRQCFPFPENLDKDKVNKIEYSYGDAYFLFNQKLEKWFRIETRDKWYSPVIEMEDEIVPDGDRWQPEFRRRLEPSQEVIIIYDSNIGYVEKPARFVKYEQTAVGNSNHHIPVFECENKRMTGLECFWLLPHEAQNPDKVHKIQYDLLKTQVNALTIGKNLGYDIPQKIKDPEIRKMAEENNARMEAIIEKFGFDPTDTSWIEIELASTTRERNWFKFERENALAMSDKWDDMIHVYNQQYEDSITIEEAKRMSKKWYRFVLGSHNIRLRGQKDRKQWVEDARSFEKTHREREHRMLTWSLARKNKFPHIRAKKPIPFAPGPYFSQCIEKCPQLFTNASCTVLKQGTILRVVSFDPELKFVKLDFIEEIHELIRGEVDAKPWVREGPDYIIMVKPEEFDTHLEILESLE